MKIVRLNDKMWFGKYLGMSIKDVLMRDKKFLDVLVNKGKISYHENVQDFLNENKENKGDVWYRQNIREVPLDEG